MVSARQQVGADTVSTGAANNRVAIYINSVATARGAEQVAALLAKGFADKGYQVDFLVENVAGWLIDDLRRHSPGIQVHNLEPDGGEGLSDILFRVYATAKALFSRGMGWHCRLQLARVIIKKKPPLLALIRYQRGHRPAAVISLLNAPNIFLMLARLTGSFPSRLIVTVHNTLSISVSASTSKWKRSIPALMRCLHPLADKVVAVSGGVALDLVDELGLPASSVEVVYNPVVRPEMKDLAAEPVDHEWLNNKTCPVLIAACKLKPQKDLPMLLRAFQKVREQRPGRLLILGEGPDRDSLEQLALELGIAADVQFAGFVQNPFAYYRRADLFVMSSAWEGLPTALIEALACGCPVVSTDCPSGPAEILDKGRYGRLVPVGDHQALAEGILEVLDSPPSAALLEERANYFSLADSVNQYEKLLVMGGEPGAAPGSTQVS